MRIGVINNSERSVLCFEYRTAGHRRDMEQQKLL